MIKDKNITVSTMWSIISMKDESTECQLKFKSSNKHNQIQIFYTFSLIKKKRFEKSLRESLLFK